MKKHLKKYWPIFGLAVISLIVVYYLINARTGDIKDSIISRLIPEEGIRLENIQYIQNNPDEGMKWTLNAREVKFSKDRQHISFEDFKLRLEPENKPPVELVGQQGTYNKSLDEIQLRGRIRGVFEDGYRIDAERLLYQQRKRALKSDDFVRITGPFFSIQGKGLRVDLERKNFQILSDVTTIIDRETLIL